MATQAVSGIDWHHVALRTGRRGDQGSGVGLAVRIQLMILWHPPRERGRVCE